MARAILMTRVSSDEQAKGYSLGDQQDRLLKYCSSNNIEIVDIYLEDHSAKDFNRPEWKKIWTRIKKEYKVIDFLLFTSWDRFSRNIAESYKVIKDLEKYEVIPQAIEQPIDLKIPENKAMLAFYLAIPEIDNDRRSIKICGGIRKAWKSGRWTHKAPRGYKNSRDENNKPMLVPHPADSKVIKHIFKEIANHTSTQAELLVYAKSRGMEASKTLISRILSNPLYMGKIRVPAYEDEPEHLAQGIHEPIISEKLFYKVQAALVETRIRTKKATKLMKVREELPLRGHLLCCNCNHPMTGSASRGRNGNRHFYYHCNKCDQKQRVRANLIHEKTEELLRQITFGKHVEKLYEEVVKDVFSGKKGNKETEIKTLRKRVSTINKRLKKAQLLLLDEQIELSDYQEMKANLEAQKSELERKIKLTQVSNSDFEKYLNQGIGIIKNLYKYYVSANTREKQKIVGSIFPENLIFSNNRVRTTRMNSVIANLLLKINDLHKEKTGQVFLKPDLFRLVESEGIEPSSKQGTLELSTCLSSHCFSS